MTRRGVGPSTTRSRRESRRPPRRNPAGKARGIDFESVRAEDQPSRALGTAGQGRRQHRARDTRGHDRRDAHPAQVDQDDVLLHAHPDPRGLDGRKRLQGFLGPGRQAILGQPGRAGTLFVGKGQHPGPRLFQVVLIGARVVRQPGQKRGQQAIRGLVLLVLLGQRFGRGGCGAGVGLSWASSSGGSRSSSSSSSLGGATGGDDSERGGTMAGLLSQ